MFRSILLAAIVAITTQAIHLKGRGGPPPIMGTDSGTCLAGCDGQGSNGNKNFNFNSFSSGGPWKTARITWPTLWSDLHAAIIKN